jgi:hypothetical protein
MATITSVAKEFFEACEAGKGWPACRAYCAPHASFASQAEPLADIRSLEGYTEWMKWLLSFMPNGRYAVKSFATDAEACSPRRILARAAPAHRPARAPIPITST